MGNSISVPNNLSFVVISDKKQAQLILNEAEQEDFYLEECHDDKLNSLSRQNLTYTPNNISLRDLNYANNSQYMDGKKLKNH